MLTPAPAGHAHASTGRWRPRYICRMKTNSAACATPTSTCMMWCERPCGWAWCVASDAQAVRGSCRMQIGAWRTWRIKSSAWRVSHGAWSRANGAWRTWRMAHGVGQAAHGARCAWRVSHGAWSRANGAWRALRMESVA
eukprot:360854-Chlamydomonas_euryale.AAC.4